MLTPGRRSIGITVAACLSLMALAPIAAADGPSTSRRDSPPALSELLVTWTRPVPRLPGRAAASQGASRLDVLDALAGGPQGRVRCASPLLLALRQRSEALNQPTRLLVEGATRRPADPLMTTFSSPGGEFLIHYTLEGDSTDRVDPTDTDLSGTPDGVERIAAELTDIFADFVHTLDWSPVPIPEPGSSRRVPRFVTDVYLVGLGTLPEGPAQLEGFTVPMEPGDPRLPGREGAASAIFLNSGLAAPGTDSRALLAHQVAHLVQMRESTHESPWWHEASAAWLEDRLEGSAVRIASTLAIPERRATGLAGDTVGLGLEAFLWPHYLVRSTGSDASLIRKIWEEMAAVPGNNTIDAFNHVLAERLGSSLVEEIRVFNVWNLFLGEADDGAHYPFGRHLPTPQGDATFETFPVSSGSLNGPISPLGAGLIRLLGDGSRGGLHVWFFGEAPGQWDLSLIVYSAVEPGKVFHVPVEIGEAGRGAIVLPWKDLAAIDVLIQNLGKAGGGAADYSFYIGYDPTIPYDLLGFTASESAGGVTLTWTTEEEQSLAGWNIYRGPSPLGPFSRINRYLLPGAGRPAHPMSYVFVDSAVEAGRKYYYYVEGVTFEGFSESSHPAGVRLGSR